MGDGRWRDRGGTSREEPPLSGPLLNASRLVFCHIGSSIIIGQRNTKPKSSNLGKKNYIYLSKMYMYVIKIALCVIQLITRSKMSRLLTKKHQF